MLDSSNALAGIPPSLRTPLLQTYQEIVTNFAEHRWEPSELNGGKFCEVVYTIVNDVVNRGGIFSARPAKPKNMVSACRDLESTPAQVARVGDRSLRILIPRVLLALYEIRNNRGVGHAGGDVDANFMDATAVYSMASWTLAELIRIFHQVSTTEAQQVVDVLVERKISLVWTFEEIRRVLDPKMSKVEQTLVLLYSSSSPVNEEVLLGWVEYSSLRSFRANVLQELHKRRLIEYDEKKRFACISPLGTREVEQKILRTRTPS
jgi:hypothetical protein